MPPAAKDAPSSTGAAAASQGAETLVGLDVFASDGRRVGQVEKVRQSPDGKVAELHVKVGGFLGFWARTVAIPADRFARVGERVQLGMTSEEAGKLPDVDPQSG